MDGAGDESAAAAGATGVGADELVVDVVVTEWEVLEYSLKEMLPLVFVLSLSRAEGGLSLLPLALTKEWFWGRTKDWREAFAMDGWRTKQRMDRR